MEEQNFRVFYLGRDPFTGKIVEALFAKRGIGVTIAKEENTLFIDSLPSDVILLDLADQIYERSDINQVLLSFEPVQNEFLKYWCKTPMNEQSLDNLLYYIRKKDLLIGTKGKDFHFSTKSIEAFLSGDEEGITEVVAEFIENLHTNYRKLDEYVRSNDSEKVRNVAHKMLSGTNYYEVDELNRVLKRLESSADFPPKELFEMLEKIYGQIILLRSGLIRKFF